MVFAHIYPAHYNPVRIKKVEKMFESELDFKNIKFPVKIRDIHKIERNGVVSALMFLIMKKIQSYIKKYFQKTC